ncbi:MAG TPA: MFS transporter [Nocardioides sp.]|uniref:MFS transporter n=1 Tax=Nocardioides sp. TaxID=35761 RepID=UPI002F40A427
MPEQIHDIGRRRAWVIWLAGLAVYVLAIFNRSSLGVAGLLATSRFGISATQLSFFTVLQLVVYAGLQVPIGVLLDRFGSRLLLLCGLALMTTGQVAFAFATSFPVAVLARALVGAGDAAIFVSVIRLVTLWFLVRQAPMITQLTGQLGQLGAIAAAAPLSMALHHLGWTKSFAIASSLGIVGMVGVALMIKDSPYAREEVARVKMRALARTLRLVWGNPGTRLGLWSHFTSQFSGTVFTLLWGFPFLVSGEGLSSGTASNLLMVMTAWIIVSGLVLGTLVSRYPFYRSWMVLGIVAAMALGWAAVLLRSAPAPTWMLVVLVCLMATGGPASMVGFDLARTFIPIEASGRANGFVNIGGFSASLVSMGLIGVLLDWYSGGGGTDTYDLADFRVAMSVQFVFWALGAAQIVRYRRKAIRHLNRLHPGVVDAMKRGEPVVHLGFHEREGV